MKVLFAGTPLNAAETLTALHNNGIEIAGVLTRIDAPVGRKRVVTPSPVAIVAEHLGIPVIKANRVDELVLEQIKSVDPDLGIAVAYGAIFKAPTLEALPLGWINVHFSLLPDWRGAAPVQHSILNGDKTTGITIFQLDEGMDTGPVHLQVPTEISPAETSGELLSRLTKLGVSGLLEVLPRIAAGLASTTAQTSNGQARIATKLSRELAHIDWSDSAFAIEHKVCAMNPEPMAWTSLDGESFRIISARALGAIDWATLEGTELEPGTLLTKEKRALVTCGKGTLLELKEVQPSGKQIMNAADWHRGMQTNKKVQFS